MGCQQSKAKAQPTESVQAPIVAAKPTPVVVAVKPVAVVPIVPEVREASPVAIMPEEPAQVESIAEAAAPSESRSVKSVSVCSSIASDVAPNLSVIFKHGNLETMLKRWNQRQMLDARDESARLLIADVLGTPSLTGMFCHRSLTPVSTPLRQDLFSNMLNSFSSPPREWSASPRRQCTLSSMSPLRAPQATAVLGSMSPLRAPQPTTILGSMSPVGSPRTGLRAPQATAILGSMSPLRAPQPTTILGSMSPLRAPQPTAIVLESTVSDVSMPTPDDLLAELFRGDSEVIVTPSEVVATPASPSRLANRSFATLNAAPVVASPTKRAPSVQNIVDTENAIPLSSATPIKSFTKVEPCTPTPSKMTKANNGHSSKKASAVKVSAAEWNGPVASKWEKGSRAQMQTDLFQQMMLTFERQNQRR